MRCLWVPTLNGNKIITNILQWFTNDMFIKHFFKMSQHWQHPAELVSVGLKLIPIQPTTIISGENGIIYHEALNEELSQKHMLIDSEVQKVIAIFTTWSWLCTWSCMLVWVSSSAFFSNDITHTFLFCLHLVAAALFLSRNFRRRSSGSSSTTRLRRPPLGGGDCIVCMGCICWVAGDIWNKGWKVSAPLSYSDERLPPSNQTL